MNIKKIFLLCCAIFSGLLSIHKNMIKVLNK
jgi:hypothetical protein